jgi:hypothetical protein
MHRHSLGVSLSTASGEHQTSLNIVAVGTLESVVLEAGDRHGVVRRHVH